MDSVLPRSVLTIQDVIDLSNKIEGIASGLFCLQLHCNDNDGRESRSQLSELFSELNCIAVEWALLESQFITGDAASTVSIGGSVAQESGHHAVIYETLHLGYLLFSRLHAAWPKPADSPSLNIPPGLRGKTALLVNELAAHPDCDLAGIEKEWHICRKVIQEFYSPLWLSDFQELFSRLRREGSAAVERLARFHLAPDERITEASRTIELLPSPQLEADGPVADRRWRYQGQILPGQMTRQVHRLASYLFQFKDLRDVRFSELINNEIVSADDDQTIAKHGRNVTKWFKDRDVPLRVSSTTGKPATMTLSTVSSDGT